MLTAVENTPNERSLLATPGLSQTALSALLDNAGRMSSGSSQVASPTVAGTPGGFMPLAPLTLAEMGIPETELEALVLKLLLHRGVLAGRTIADQLALPFQPLQKMLQRMKTENLVVYKGSTHLHDYAYDLTPSGFERAQRYRARCSYIGAAPVSLRDYTNSVSAQSCHKTRPQLEDVRRAFADIILSPGTIDKLGQAARGGKAMFLYGSPGNGKTTIAERICRAFGPTVWVPRAINIDGEMIRVFDPPRT